jgi:hypothetical protein
LAVYPLLGFLGSCGGGFTTPTSPPGSGATCDPSAAPQLISVTVQNQSANSLSSFPISIVLNASNFDFASAAKDGSDLGVWDPQTQEPIPYWIESYDATAGEAFVWANLRSIPLQTSVTIWLTSGSIAHCGAQSGNGYAVFPFFSDAQDVKNWNANQLTLSDTVKLGPLTIQSRQTIESDGTYNSTPGVVQAANGDWVLSYRKGTEHVNTPLVILRRSRDQGTTWTPEVAYWNTSGNDPSLARTPGGDLLIEFVKNDPNGVAGAAYSRSADNGVTWSPFIFFDQPVSNTSALPTLFIHDGPTMYAAAYGPSTAGTGDSPFLWTSADDGLTWSKRSELRGTLDPGMSETSIAETTPGTFLAISRADDDVNTYGRYSHDLGFTWDTLNSYTSQVGVLQLPQLLQAGSMLLLFGRENFFSTTQLVAYVSSDGGQTFSYGTVVDHYLNNPIDGGYCWPMLLPDGRVFVVFYSDTLGLRLPDIKSVFLQVGTAQEVAANAIHITSQFQQGLASRALNLSATRYALDFRFSTHDTPAGNQFAVLLQDASVQPAVPIVNWELPSEFPGGAGFVANGQFMQLFNSFSYDQSYRVRTVVDEGSGQQVNEILDQFGNVTVAGSAQPFAQGTAGHPTQVVIGNNTPRRNVDARLEFLLVRPLATSDPQITVLRVH